MPCGKDHNRHPPDEARLVKDQPYRVPESFCEGQEARNSTRVRSHAPDAPRPQFKHEDEGAPKI
jgi:hypothetical protein